MEGEGSTTNRQPNTENCLTWDQWILKQTISLGFVCMSIWEIKNRSKCDGMVFSAQPRLRVNKIISVACPGHDKVMPSFSNTEKCCWRVFVFPRRFRAIPKHPHCALLLSQSSTDEGEILVWGHPLHSHQQGRTCPGSGWGKCCWFDLEKSLCDLTLRVPRTFPTAWVCGGDIQPSPRLQISDWGQLPESSSHFVWI